MSPDPPPIGRVQLRDADRLRAAARTIVVSGVKVRRRRDEGERTRDAVAHELRHAFEHLGPTYTKLGQMVASSPGLFPPFLTDALQGCLDDVRPLDAATVARVITEELGDRPEALFAEFDTTPLASASIGQVHRAWRTDGTPVVVKVQRPGIGELVAKDLRIMHLLARGAERTSKYARLAQPVAILEDFAATIDEELSFMVEARSMERVAAGLADFPDADRIHIPEVDWRFTAPRVLTMEFVAGTRLDDVDALTTRGVDAAGLLKTAVRSWLHGTLVHGVFHGDLHAGNLLVDEADRATFLDFGICGHLTDEARLSLLDTLPALMSRDIRSVAENIFRTADTDRELPLDAITADLEKAILPIFERPLAEVSYASVFIEVVRAGVRHEVVLPRDLILVFKQFFYVERFSRLLAPDWSPLTDPDLLDAVVLANQRRAA